MKTVIEFDADDGEYHVRVFFNFETLQAWLGFDFQTCESIGEFLELFEQVLPYKDGDLLFCTPEDSGYDWEEVK